MRTGERCEHTRDCRAEKSGKLGKLEAAATRGTMGGVLRFFGDGFSMGLTGHWKKKVSGASGSEEAAKGSSSASPPERRAPTGSTQWHGASRTAPHTFFLNPEPASFLFFIVAQRESGRQEDHVWIILGFYLNCYSSHTLDNCIFQMVIYLSINHVIMKFLWSFNK